MAYYQRPGGLWVRVEFTSVAIASRLVNRFDLQSTPIDPNEAMLLERTIQPVTQADELLREPVLADETMDLSPVAAWNTIDTVPEGKRWTLKWARKPATTGAAGFYLSDGTVYNSIVASQTATGVYTGSPIVLKQGWILATYNTNNGGDAARVFEYIYETEDAY